MDMRMPNLDGYEATRQIRSWEGLIASSPAENIETGTVTPGHRTKIIALTASAFEEQRQVVMEAGCDDFIRKPVKTDELFEKMRQHLGVQFIYRDDPQIAKPRTLPLAVDSYLLRAESLVSMPTQWIEELNYAAAQGSDDLIAKLIQQIPEEEQHLANALGHLASVFQFDRIIALTESLLPGGDV
ncbi:MAG TPA: response regulator, partial [Coleofasciculaceae cyanobacterium]